LLCTKPSSWSRELTMKRPANDSADCLWPGCRRSGLACRICVKYPVFSVGELTGDDRSARRLVERAVLASGIVWCLVLGSLHSGSSLRWMVAEFAAASASRWCRSLRQGASGRRSQDRLDTGFRRLSALMQRGFGGASLVVLVATAADRSSGRLRAPVVETIPDRAPGEAAHENDGLGFSHGRRG